jgi:hypothetical protein
VSGRGLATAGSLILIALACIAIAKRLERERRLIRKLQDAGAVPLDSLSDDERDTVESLRAAGVLRVDSQRGVFQPEGLRAFRAKRVRFALTGALIALVLCVIVAYAILR